MNIKPPKRLSQEAKKKFKELEPYYVLSSPLLVEILAQFCEQWERYIAAGIEADKLESTFIQVGTNGATQPHATITTQHKCMGEMRRHAKILLESAGTPKGSAKLMDKLNLDE